MKRWIGIAALALGWPAGALAAEPSCGDVLVVLDRSGSMNMCSIDGFAKEEIAKTAIKGVIAKFPTTPMGLFVFPDSVTDCLAGCRVGRTVIDISPDGGGSVSTWIDTMATPSCGGTPTGASLEAVRDYKGWIEGKSHFVLLVTDGQPTCDDGFTDEMKTVMCNGLGSSPCNNPTRAYDAIADMASRDIHTFVVGFEGMGVGLGCTGPGGLPYNPDTLNKMAELGLEPNQGGPNKYYAATNDATLAETLDAILGKVSGGTVGGCQSASGGQGGQGGDDGSGGQGAKDGTGGQAAEGGQGGQGGFVRPQRPGHEDGCGCDLGGPPIGRSAAAAVVVVLLSFARRRRGR